MDKSNALVSVIIVTKDRLELLIRAVQSVVSQTYQCVEIIIVDNQSTLPLELHAFKELAANIKIVRTASYLTAAKSRNYGIFQVQGDFVCFLDDDDYYYPKKIQRLMDEFLINKNIDIAVGNTRMLGVNGAELGLCVGSSDIVSLMLDRGSHLNAVMIKKAALLTTTFDEEMTTFEDVDFMFRLFVNFKCVHVDEELAVWNRDNRGDQLTNKNYKRSEKNWLILCEKFSAIIITNKSLARFYFRKMFLLSVINLHFFNAARYFYKFVYYGFLKG